MGRASENEVVGREAVKIANEIEAICQGRPTASVYIAISMILGNAAAKAPKPDFEGMMALVDRTALHEFRRALRSQDEEER